MSLSVAAALGLAGCTGGDGSGSTPEPTATLTASPTPEPATATETHDEREHEHDTATPEPEVVTVRMTTDNNGSYFDPKGLLVDPGETVRFVNELDVHSAAAYHPANDKALRIPEGADPFDSELIEEEGETFEVTFETEGVYDYFCLPHESLGMVGRIIVGSPQGGPGTTEPETLPPTARTVLPSVDEIMEAGSVAGP